MRTAENKYKKRIAAYQNLLNKQLHSINLISNLRLLFFFAGLAGIAISYYLRYYYVLGALVVGVCALFVYLVTKHSQIKTNKKMTSILLDINKKFLARITDQWKTFKDTGHEFINPEHSFTLDLDIFGEGSLYQMINCTITYKGRHKLKELLSSKTGSLEDIKKRQQAIAELSERLRWRQHFMGEAMMIMDKPIDPHPLFDWASNSNTLSNLWGLIKLIRWLPIITIPAVVLLFTTKVLPWYIPICLVVIHFVLLGWNASHFSKIFETANQYKDVIKTYYELIFLFEKKSFQSEYLKSLKNRLVNQKGLTACQQINKLMKIIDAIDNRANAFFFIINLLTLWDYQYIVVLERWKKASGSSLEKWFEAIGEVEALSSLAVLKHDNPEWATPKFVENSLSFDAKDLGHPLLFKNRVTNSLELRNNANILLITGSNMSGKSTLLRTAGISLVMAYAGAPVCAKAFRCSLMQIRTCMRTTDNLENSTSSFYAELLRIKDIVKSSERGERLFFLLDEIFKGTNSSDRHTGAEAVIDKLSKSTALGLVSTHDLELGDIEHKNHCVRNFHFREFYTDDKINFDYKLRPGVSTTRNAVYLMKMAGIDI